MKIIYNNLIPVPGFSAMMLFGIIFARKKYRPISDKIVKHEEFHVLQCRQDYHKNTKEDKNPSIWAWIKFYGVYLSQWVRYGYANIPIEREAYAYCTDLEYIKNRTKKAWKKYLQ